MKNHKYNWHSVHTKNRYLERFNSILSDDEYNELCSMTIIEDSIRLSKNKYKRVVIFNEQYIWCTFNRYKYIITVYPLHKNEILSYNNGKIDYSQVSLKYKQKNDRKKILKKAKKYASSSESTHLS